MEITRSYEFTKKDAINATANSTPLQKAPEKIEVKALAIAENVPDSNGDIKTVGYLVDVSGEVFGTISETAIRSIDGIIDYIAEDTADTVTINVNRRQSAGGRTFITLTID